MRTNWLDKWENEQDNKNEDFNERAAIMQYDGNMTKEKAEELAFEIIEKKHSDFSIYEEQPNV